MADVPTDHPSCSKQHAVLQYRCVAMRPGGHAPEGCDVGLGLAQLCSNCLLQLTCGISKHAAKHTALLLRQDSGWLC